ncbi:MAG: conserved hypothetical protein [Candidatus Desulfovibrio kirbyi]|uniref:DUF2325 domain-containing protein n=1 Tax=Candidatus Desulfovibrio kirbyi TaxID=2696086 RepID=A0A6L2R4M9_9BACT|nr:DUF2325 domain-containing protein [Desulfovibrio sp.]GFH62473.1 MAG: conserved hypothetical protein [Candidatus Desulfovibrio kirbyi]
MSFVLIGGIDRLKPNYIAAARLGGHSLKCLSRNECNFNDKLGHPDALIVFTNKVSHEAKRKAVQFANTHNIPLHLLHSCGVSSLKNYLKSSKG